MKFMHCADLHLGGPGGGERMHAFLRMLEVCAQEDVQMLLIAGDLFDAPRVDARTVDAVFGALGAQDGLCVLIAAGNHDPACPGGSYDRALPDNVHVFGAEWSCVEIPAYGARVWGASFAGEKQPPFAPEKRRLRLTEGLCDLGVLHGEVTSAGARSDYRAISPESIAATGVQYLALGHVHARSLPARAGHTVYAYSGCAQGAGFDEVGEKGAYLGTLDENGLALSFVRLCGSMTVEAEADATGCADLSQLMQRCAQAVGEQPKNRVRLRITGTAQGFAVDVPALERMLSGRAAQLRVQDDTRAQWDYDALARESTLRGAFVRRMRERIAQAEKSGDARTERLALELGLRAFDGEVDVHVDRIAAH